MGLVTDGCPCDCFEGYTGETCDARADCAEHCATNEKPWEKKCRWKRCSGCAACECSTLSTCDECVSHEPSDGSSFCGYSDSDGCELASEMDPNVQGAVLEASTCP